VLVINDGGSTKRRDGPGALRNGSIVYSAADQPKSLK